MGLHTNSDYEVISNAEISTAISKYSQNMIDISLDNILGFKNSGEHVARFGIGNMVQSYENNFKIDMQKYPQAVEELSELRIDCYNRIMDKICEAHSLSYNLPSDADIYTSAFYMYSFLISDFYRACINFFVNYIMQESESLCSLCGLTSNDLAHQYAKKRYNTKSSLGVIHTNLDKVLDQMGGFDITIYDFIYMAYKDKMVANYLNTILIDNGNFFRNFCHPAVSGYNRAEAVTNIRLALLPVNSSQIKNYIEEEN